MNQFELALSKLDKLKKTSNGYDARCPCHDDNVQSLSIKEGDDGEAIFYCHAGCNYKDIITSLGLEGEKPIVEPVIEATYAYTNERNELLYEVVRYKPKAFKHRRPDGKGGWVWNMNGIKPTLYHLPEVMGAIADDSLVFIVEGEKDVECLRSRYQFATSISGGASSKWSPEIIPIFQGAKVVVIPDNDTAGRKYANYVASILDGWCASIKVICLPAKDASDYLITKTIDNLLNIVHNTPEYEPKGAVKRDEFETFKGVNAYLWKQVRQLKAERYQDGY